MTLATRFMPRLVALTEPARRAVKGDVTIIERFPFRIGRESRVAATVMASDRRIGSPPVNDLFISESDEILHVSREHLTIDQEGGGFVLIDAGSLNGTIVEGQRVGGDRVGGRTVLRDHDVIIIGSAASPFIFKFRTS